MKAQSVIIEKDKQTAFASYEDVKKTLETEISYCKDDGMDKGHIESFINGFYRSIQELNILTRDEEEKLSRVISIENLKD